MIENIGAYSQVDFDRGYQQGTSDTVDNAIELLKKYPLIKAMGEILKLKEQNK